ncbi:hypothetical protein [Rhizobium sp. SSA_523]|uniref:hypothetical protein n=1 Tax=Rhizobium sp. SSA_523 TaxID=2952477 RepID=UPI0020902B91|nr:hypothetical protein [Rhizobium sp. SSA_523]MCO5732211.1 hypothetical protein [Rhizobium sp. SSA_523]WKC21377.1 hypothetical protein QTJ18_05715 [Rhizobium sp. SSA_523]
MFLDLKSYGPRPEPRQPAPPERRISPRGEKVLVWIICFNLLVLCIAPIGGASVIDALIAVFR